MSKETVSGVHLAGLTVAILVLGSVSCGWPWGGEDFDTTTTTTMAPVAQKTLRIGLVPSQNPGARLEALDPLFVYLERKLNVRIEPSSAKDYSEFIQRMEESSYDIAFLGPFSYVQGHAKAGYTAVVRPVRYGGTSYRSMIIVKKGSGIRTLEDLRGKKFAFVDKKSTAGYLFPAALLLEHGIHPTRDLKSEFLNGHDNVVLNVLAGFSAAGACYKDARQIVIQSRPEVMDRTEILAETPDIPNEPIAVSAALKRDRADFVSSFVRAMVEIKSDPDSTAIFAGLKEGIEGYAEVQDSDYDVVRRAVEKLGPEAVGD